MNPKYVRISPIFSLTICLLSGQPCFHFSGLCSWPQVLVLVLVFVLVFVLVLVLTRPRVFVSWLAPMRSLVCIEPGTPVNALWPIIACDTYTLYIVLNFTELYLLVCAFSL